MCSRSWVLFLLFVFARMSCGNVGLVCKPTASTFTVFHHTSTVWANTIHYEFKLNLNFIVYSVLRV